MTRSKSPAQVLWLVYCAAATALVGCSDPTTFPSGGATTPIGSAGSDEGAGGSGTLPTGSGGSTTSGGSTASGGSDVSSGTTGAGGSDSGAGGIGAGGGANGAAGGSTDASVPLDPSLLSKCSGTKPILCTLNAPNGNWDVTAEVGDPAVASNSRLSAETKHFQGSAAQTAAGMYSLLTFTVNVRAEKHDGGQSAPSNLLDIMIDGTAPKLHGLGIRSAPSSITIFFAGDSTACDWVDTNTSALEPGETGWAQELSVVFKPGVAVANYADSGETAGGFYSKFFDPYATSLIKAGDYVFIEFGTNDSKNQADIDNYKKNLMVYVNIAKSKGATPVILTPLSRKSGTAADPGFPPGQTPALGLDQQARDLAAAQKVALIDMTVVSRDYYLTVADKTTLFTDGGTHLSEAGAIGVANAAAAAIKASTLPLKNFVR